MRQTLELPKTLQEAVSFFSDPQKTFDYAVKLRWPDGDVTCPRCDGTEHSFISTRRIWFCKGCKKQFTVKVGTIFEDSALGMDKWMVGVWLIVNAKNGIRRKRVITERGVKDKTAVMGILERGGRVRAMMIPNRKKHHIQGEIRAHVKAESAIYSDALLSYYGLNNQNLAHQVVDHAESYVNGQVHTNGMENFWSLLKRGLKGTYIAVEPFHLFRYLDEQVFRDNNRAKKDHFVGDGDRFQLAMQHIAGKRLTYQELTGKGTDSVHQ